MNNALHKIRRYVIVEVQGTHDDVKEVMSEIDRALDGAYVSYWGCNGCGCPTKPYSPNEQQPCEDELCGHNCEDCGCIKFCIICEKEVGSNEDYCSLECRGAKRQ